MFNLIKRIFKCADELTNLKIGSSYLNGRGEKRTIVGEVDPLTPMGLLGYWYYDDRSDKYTRDGRFLKSDTSPWKDLDLIKKL